jgi:hypothetical protein
MTWWPDARASGSGVVMNNRLLGAAFAAVATFVCAAASAHGGPPPGGWRAPPGVYHGGPVRPLPPVARPPVYPVWGGGYWGPGYWRPGYWGPRVGVYVGAPAAAYWGAWPYVAPVAVAAPPVAQVIVTPAPAPVAQPVGYWYYCAQPAGYYPYVQQCSQAWMTVLPQAPGSAVAPQLAP